MAKFSRLTIQPLVKTSDLKKAIVEKNRKLGESVSILKQEIKSLKSEKKQAEKELRSKQADCEDVFNELKSAGKELSAVQKKSLSAKKKLDERLVLEATSKGSCRRLESSISDLQNKHKDLTGKIAYLQKEEEEYNLLIQSSKSLKINVEHTTDQLARLKSSKSRFKKQTDTAAKKCNEMIDKQDKVKASLEEATESFKAELKVIDKKLSIARSKSQKDSKALEDSVIEKNLLLNEIDLMISKAETEYMDLEKKINVAKNNILEEESRQEAVKKNFETWKVTAVEEVARMKLRGKMEKIDKAGLKDVLNR
jgi:chromosome segregation ATPase